MIVEFVFRESRGCEVWWESIVCECDCLAVEYRGSTTRENKGRENVVAKHGGRESATT